MSQILAASGQSDGAVTPEGLRWLMERCLEAGSAERLQLPGLRDDRRPVIAGGLSLLYTLAMNFGIAELQPARGALRQGVIFDLAARQEVERRAAVRARDIREASVRELQRRFQVDGEQAGRVEVVALALLDDIAPETPSEARRELRWAAALHETGMMISHHDHHRHSAYVLAHVDAPGFSQSQLRRIGDLVLGQRGGLRKLETRLQELSFALHLFCLRLAVIVCHARGDVDPDGLALRGQAGQPTLAPALGWAESHPRALHLLREEIEAWGRTGVLRPALAPS